MTRFDDPVTGRIIGTAIEVHRELGPGLLESAYQKAMEIELRRAGLMFVSQMTIPVTYKGEALEVDYRIDFLIQSSVIMEIKSVEKLLPVHKAQLITYLKLCKLTTGLLINFNQAFLIEGVRRVVLDEKLNTLRQTS